MSSIKAKRTDLRTNEKIELSERGKLETWIGLQLDKTFIRKTYFYNLYLFQ